MRKWRREANGRFPAAQEHKPASEAFLNDALAQFDRRGERLTVAYDFDADHQAQAAHVCDAVGVSLGHLLEAAFQAIAHEAGVLDEAVLQQLERRECCRDGHRIPSEGGGVGTRGPAHHIGACDGDKGSPDAMPLAMAMMSGATSKCSHPHRRQEAASLPDVLSIGLLGTRNTGRPMTWG